MFSVFQVAHSLVYAACLRSVSYHLGCGLYGDDMFEMSSEISPIYPTKKCTSVIDCCVMELQWTSRAQRCLCVW